MVHAKVELRTNILLVRTTDICYTFLVKQYLASSSETETEVYKLYLII